MSILGLFDSTIRVYAVDESAQSRTALGDIDRTPKYVGQFRGTIQFVRTNSRDDGAGGRSAGEALLFVEKRSEIPDNSILLVYLGPQKGTWWETMSNFTPSRSRWHTEHKIRPYIGTLPVRNDTV